MNLQGKTALVTGATGGIGSATAERLAALGARIVAQYRRRDRGAERLLAGLPGGGHAALQADLADAGAAGALVDRALAVSGRIDVLVNNAGVYVQHPPATTDFAAWCNAWQSTLAVNLTGPAHLSFLVAHHMIERGDGRIINVSSRGAFRGEPDAPAYGASKAGLNAMSQSLAQALAPRGVSVYVVAPGFVETEMAAELLAGPGGEAIRAQSPLGRVAQPPEIAETIAFLAAGAPAFMTGAIVDVNGASYLRS